MKYGMLSRRSHDECGLQSHGQNRDADANGYRYFYDVTGSVQTGTFIPVNPGMRPYVSLVFLY